MKLRIHLTPNRDIIPFNYAYQLCGVFHNWLGANELHNLLSLYSLGWLNGKVKASENGLSFPKGAYWDVGIHDNEIAERLVRGILLKEIQFYGMNIRKADRLKPPSFKEKEHYFLAGSPILLRKKEDNGRRDHVTFKEPQKSNQLLKRIIRKKGLQADLASVKDLDIHYDQDYTNPKTKLINIKGIKNKASVCPVIAKGPAEAIEFLWTVGAGDLTGIGFGSLDHTDKLY